MATKHFKYTKHAYSLILAIAVAVLAGCAQHPARAVRADPAVNAGKIGSRLPDFSAKDFQGKEISSADLRGKVAIIDFWATWCAPCKVEMPGYQKLVDQYGSRGLAAVGFKATMMQDTENPVVFARKAGIRYPLAVSTPDIVADFGGLKGLPTTFVYDRQGILRQKIIGFEPTSDLEKILLPLLNAKDGPPTEGE